MLILFDNVFVTFVLLCILIVYTFIKKLYKETYFIFLLIVVFFLYVPSLLFIYFYFYSINLIIFFINLLIISIIMFVLGVRAFKYPVINFNTYKLKTAYIILLISLFIYYFDVFFLKNYINFSKIVEGFFILSKDFSVILFWGVLGIFLKSKIKYKYLIIVLALFLFSFSEIILMLYGLEYSRFHFIIILLYLFLIFYEKLKIKSVFFISIIIIFLYLFFIIKSNLFIFFKPGDLLITKYALDIIQEVNNNSITYKLFMIPYNLGFNLFPDINHMKPILYNPNAQYFMHILGWSIEEIKKYPYGIGVTGIADAYWNLGIIGVIFYFFLAGLFLGFLKKLAFIYKSGFAYGLYLYQIIKIFLLYRLDFSFYFGHLLFTLPFILYIVKVKKL